MRLTVTSSLTAHSLRPATSAPVNSALTERRVARRFWSGRTAPGAPRSGPLAARRRGSASSPPQTGRAAAARVTGWVQGQMLRQRKYHVRVPECDRSFTESHPSAHLVDGRLRGRAPRTGPRLGFLQQHEQEHGMPRRHEGHGCSDGAKVQRPFRAQHEQKELRLWSIGAAFKGCANNTHKSISARVKKKTISEHSISPGSKTRTRGKL